MTDSEFGRWLMTHKQAFPGVGDWLRKNPDTVRHWQAAMADVDLDAAEQATAEMLRGDIDSPRGYSDHVRAVRQRAKEIRFADREERRPTRIDGQDTYSCHLCRDSGYVLVLDAGQGGQQLLEWARGDRSQPRPAAKTSLVACTCPTGDAQQQQLRNRRKPLKPREIDRYDATRHFRCEFQWPNVDTIQGLDGTKGLQDWEADRFNWWKDVA